MEVISIKADGEEPSIEAKSLKSAADEQNNEEMQDKNDQVEEEKEERCKDKDHSKDRDQPMEVEEA